MGGTGGTLSQATNSFNKGRCKKNSLYIVISIFGRIIKTEVKKQSGKVINYYSRYNMF